ncbi:uncharacterized protein LOC132706727 isoform X2 [Cylas formicarius]|uniref:uncharacterized protein LOC132706727 isoform X2 n=1 Tax=Cylas formicarius TaxID=197179 RepID=UPI002958530F|nr:uncharacterized protein LOC132706727 isoform X2 [Cylas formicarius]
MAAVLKSSQRLVERTSYIKSAPSKELVRTSKKSFWQIFRDKKTVQTTEKDSTDFPDDQVVKDMTEIAKLGGRVYKTCGTAYILQKNFTSPQEVEIDPEDALIEKIEKHPSLKDETDPMPPFESVEKRLIDLSERKLHPLFKMLMSIPKKPATRDPVTPNVSYKTRSGTILPEEIPERLKIDKGFFEKKNMFWECKRVEPPQQLIARIAEIKQNELPTMENLSTMVKREQKHQNEEN